jgi:hypothetical protein
MKLFFGYCDLRGFFDDNNVKLGIGWYRHSKDHEWWGLTVEFYLIKWYVNCNFVSNYKEYDKRINYRHSEEYKKKQEERYAKIRERAAARKERQDK